MPLSPRIVIAALGGGLGKTTVALGLAASWRARGLHVAPFKKGPDYIDASWLARAAGRPCSNLDTFLMPESTMLASFARRSAGADIALIEGNRGLFDGMDERGAFSTAELAKSLRAPVALVVHCSKVTRTTAAMVLGARTFDPDVNIACVILNEVASDRQEALIRAVIEERCGVPVVGCVRRQRHPALSDRHLGVTPPEEDPEFEGALGRAAEAVSGVDLDRLLEIAGSAPDFDLNVRAPAPRPFEAPEPPLRIGVLRDTAFQFYYPENLEALESIGRIVRIAAESDATLPELDALYIGGGFPETRAQALAGNVSFRDSLRKAAADGLPIYAECGGLMYLGQSIEIDGRSFPMAGVLPARFVMRRRPVGHGYAVANIDRDNPFFPAGLTLRGHEFHYSQPVDFRPGSEARLAMNIERGTGFADGRDGLVVGNTLALYMHVHALGTPEWAEGIERAARRYRNRGEVVN